MRMIDYYRELTPVATWATAARTGRTFAKYDPPLVEIIRRHLDDDAIPDHGTDLETPHLASCIGDDAVIILQTNGEPSIRQNFLDLTIELEEFLFCHP